MKVGYVRVSTEEQKTLRQEELMLQLGVERVFIEKVSGKSTKDREQLAEMLEYVRQGDEVIVESISRLARNTRDLLFIVEGLDNKGVKFISQKEGIDTLTSSGRFMLTIFGAVAQLEREYLLMRQSEGIAIAKAQGRYKGRKRIPYSETEFARLYPLWKRKEITAREMMLRLELKPASFYRRVREYEELIIDIFQN